MQSSLVWSLCHSHVIRYRISFQSVFAVDFSFVQECPKKPRQTEPFRSLRTLLFLFSWIHPSQLRSINTTEPAAPAAEWSLSAGGSLQWNRPTANHCYIHQLRVDCLLTINIWVKVGFIYFVVVIVAASFRNMLSVVKVLCRPFHKSFFFLLQKNTRRKCICVWSRVFTEVAEDDPSLRR